MTYRGQIRNGAIVLDPPAQLPEGAAVEVSVVAPLEKQQRSPIASIKELRGEDLGDDPFGDDFDETIRKWRNEPWRNSAQESLE
ncbi:MAG: hypothetical protein M3478_01880 [Planctomycetota bacterium]|nr:hypothetical protein [Planctomycetota bacterium]